MTYDRPLEAAAPGALLETPSPASPAAASLSKSEAWAQRASELLDLSWDQPGPVVSGDLGGRRP